MHLNKNINIWQRSFLSLSLFFVLTFVFFAPTIAIAQATGKPAIDPPVVNTKLINPIGTNDLHDFVKHVLEGAIKIGIPVVAIAIIYSGFLYVTAMGNEEKLKTAHKAILYTLIGAVLLIGSWAIATLISDTVLSL